jgi:pimeloyl-ACP methyl ester carboxylesterase
MRFLTVTHKFPADGKDFLMKSRSKWFWRITAFLILVLAGLYLIFNVETQDLDQYSKQLAPGEFIQLHAGEVHYRLVGTDNAPLVILVHGFSVPSYVWDPTLTYLVDSGYQVLVYDLFGRGYSERPDTQYDIALFTNQLEELVIALELDVPFVLGGLSMGGPIAARYAHMHPEKVAGLIFIAPEVVQPGPGDVFPLNIPLVGEYLMGAVMEPFVLPKLQAADFVNPEKYPDWEEKYRIQLQYKGTGRALLSTIRNLTEHDPQEEYRALEKTGIPALLIWGKEDQTIGWEQIEVLSDLLPDIQVEIIPGAGHLPHYEKPGIVNPVLFDFLTHFGD